MRFAAFAGLVLALLAVSALPTAASAAPPTKRCWQGDRYGNNGTIPSGYNDHTKYANCSDCDGAPTLSTAKGKCELWFGRQTPDGGDGGVSHKGWPGLTGIRWQVTADGDKGEKANGSPFSDGLYGRHGSDTLIGNAGADVIWGDSNISKLNNGKQKDVLDGGDGNDWIYASHGKNTITGGAGNDHIIAYYGKGTIDCGPGKDTVTVVKKTKYKLTGCEKVKHPGK
jgi:Ca2+-binding RTX toxin-like protein